MDKIFAVFGKLILAILVIGALIGGGIYIGNKYTATPPTASVITPAVTSSASPSASIVSPTITKTADTRVSITAGGAAPFVNYMLSGFSDWTVDKSHDSSVPLDKLTIAKGQYKIIISQGPMGGAGCIFPGGTSSEMTIALTDPIKEILLLDGKILKRGKAESGSASLATYTVCQKGDDSSFGSITQFGAINYNVPLSPDAETVTQMDAMVGSLQKQ